MLLWRWQSYRLFSFIVTLSPNYLSLSSISLPPSHFALASGVLVVMESLVSLCEPLSLMRLLSHTPYQINRLHQPITTQTHQPGPRQAHRLTSSHRRSHFVIDKMWCKQRQKGCRDREIETELAKLKIYTSVFFLARRNISLFQRRIILLME